MGHLRCPKTGVRVYDKDSYVILKEAAHMAYEILQQAVVFCRAGISTLDIENYISSLIEKNKCLPAFKGYEKFPNVSCLSLNEQIVHGIAREDVILKDGDVISIDLGLIYKNHYADNAETVIIGNTEDHKNLVDLSKSAFYKGYEAALKNNSTTGDIGFSIHKHILSKVIPGGLAVRGDNIYKIFPRFEGHGIGMELHEPPNVPNTGYPGMGMLLQEGMCICIEPVIMYSSSNIKIFNDKESGALQFTTHDLRPSSHFERQVFVTKDGPEIISI